MLPGILVGSHYNTHVWTFQKFRMTPILQGMADIMSNFTSYFAGISGNQWKWKIFTICLFVYTPNLHILRTYFFGENSDFYHFKDAFEFYPLFNGKLRTKYSFDNCVVREHFLKSTPKWNNHVCRQCHWRVTPMGPELGLLPLGLFHMKFLCPLWYTEARHCAKGMWISNGFPWMSKQLKIIPPWKTCSKSSGGCMDFKWNSPIQELPSPLLYRVHLTSSVPPWAAYVNVHTAEPWKKN